LTESQCAKSIPFGCIVGNVLVMALLIPQWLGFDPKVLFSA
jgi:hypothetical protein